MAEEPQVRGSGDRQQGPRLSEPHRREGRVAGDAPGRRADLDKLIGPVKVLLDAYAEGRLSRVYLCYTRFVNTIKQEPVSSNCCRCHRRRCRSDAVSMARHIYEPDAATVIEEVLLRYTEALSSRPWPRTWRPSRRRAWWR